MHRQKGVSCKFSSVSPLGGVAVYWLQDGFGYAETGKARVVVARAWKQMGEYQDGLARRLIV